MPARVPRPIVSPTPKRVMRLRPAALAALILAPAVAVAQPACADGTLESYLSLGAAGCTIGPVSLRGFRAINPFRFPGETFLSPFTRAQGEGVVAGFSVTFSPPLSASATVGAPPTPRTTSQAFELVFDVAATSGYLRGIQVYDFVGSATGSVVPTGLRADSAYALAGGGLFVDGRSAVRQVFGDCPFSAGLCDRGPNFIELVGNVRSADARLIGSAQVTGGTIPIIPPVTFGATVSSFSAGVYVVPFVSTVPEPSTFALGAAGLALLGAVARRRRRSA